jgi:hypothetical protein
MGQLAGQALRLPRTLTEDLGKKKKRNLFRFPCFAIFPFDPAFLLS